MATIIQHRRDTSANWSSTNPVLADGEKGIETNTLKEKIGDGSTTWNSLSYFNEGSGSGAIDSVNGETGAVVLTTDDISDSIGFRYTTESDIVRLANTTGTNTGDQTANLVPVDTSSFDIIPVSATNTQLVIDNIDNEFINLKPTLNSVVSNTVYLDSQGLKIYGDDTLITTSPIIDEVSIVLGGTSLLKYNGLSFGISVTGYTILDYGSFAPNTLNHIYVNCTGVNEISVLYTQPLDNSIILNPIEEINTNYLWHKLDVSTTNAATITSSVDSLSDTSYNLVNNGTVTRAVENGQECAYFTANGHLSTSGSDMTSVFQNSFSVSIDFKMQDGQPVANEHLMSILNGTSNRFYIELKIDGKFTIVYSANGQNVFAQSANSVFADGAFTDFKNMIITVDTNDFISVYIDNVIVAMNAGFNGDMTSVDMSQFVSSASPLRIGAKGSLEGLNGWIKNVIIQPVIYTPANRLTLQNL